MHLVFSSFILSPTSLSSSSICTTASFSHPVLRPIKFTSSVYAKICNVLVYMLPPLLICIFLLIFSSWTCSRLPQIFRLGCSLTDSDSLPLKTCLRSFLSPTCLIRPRVTLSSFWDWNFSYDVIISTWSWSPQSLTCTCSPIMLVTAVLMAVAINMVGLLLRREQQKKMISAYIALLTWSRNLQMCPCKIHSV